MAADYVFRLPSYYDCFDSAINEPAAYGILAVTLGTYSIKGALVRHA